MSKCEWHGVVISHWPAGSTWKVESSRCPSGLAVTGAGCPWKKGLNLAVMLWLMHSCIQPSLPALMVHLTGAGEEADSASPSLRFGKGRWGFTPPSHCLLVCFVGDGGNCAFICLCTAPLLPLISFSNFMKCSAGLKGCGGVCVWCKSEKHDLLSCQIARLESWCLLLVKSALRCPVMI